MNRNNLHLRLAFGVGTRLLLDVLTAERSQTISAACVASQEVPHF
jgi:hypothetical protein